MDKRQGITYHSDWYCWIQVSICLILLGTISAAPVCNLTNDVLNCKANNNSDIQLLSTVAENIHLSFYSGHDVNFEDSLFPILPVLRTLTLDLRYVQSNLSSGGFKQLNNLENLYLTNSDPYRPLPTLSLESGTLTGLITLKMLNIEEIGLTQIENGALQDLTNLTELSVAQNRIQSLPESLFATTKLQRLTLSRLGEIQVSSATFQSLRSLGSLRFNRNMLQVLPPFVFSDMLNLQELNLEENEIYSLSTQAFSGLQNLLRLDIKNNNFTRLEYGIFNDLSSLFSLDVSNCQLEVIEDGVFENLSDLMFLKLASNKIQTITSSTFEGLNRLSSLELENNRLKIIESRAFSHISNLQILHLYNNEISTLDPLTFAETDVSVLTLHDNNMTSLPNGVFEPLKNLNHLDLSNNLWECDCDITWLKVWMDSLPASFVLDNADSTSCYNPPDVQGTSLQLYLALRYNECNPTTTEATMTTIELGTTGNQGDDSAGLRSSVVAIIAVCILLAIVIVVVVVIAMYCRFKKYAFWAPPKTDDPDGRHAHNDLKYKARHQVGSFYQNPETASISAMWETESMRSDYRYAIDPEGAEKDSFKDKYVYENPALNVNDANDNSVVVIDTNGMTVKELPLNIANLSPNGNVQGESHCNSSESISSKASDISPVPAHGYNFGEGMVQNDHPIKDITSEDTTNQEEYPMTTLDTVGVHSSRSTPSSSSESDAEIKPEPDLLPAEGSNSISESPEGKELNEIVDNPNVALSLDVSEPQSEDYEHLNIEPDTPSSVHDYISLRPPDNDNIGNNKELFNRVSTSTSETPENDDVDTSEVRVSVPEDSDIPTGSTDAHGGTTSYTNEAFNFSDD